MESLSELRRLGRPLVGVAFVLALYCGLVGADSVGAALAATGAMPLAVLLAVGGGPSHADR